MTLQRLEFLPGVVKTETEYSQPGRWIDASYMRFVRDRPQTIGGWEQLGVETLDGCARGVLAYRDTNSQRYLIAGTHQRVFRVLAGGSKLNITPVAQTDTLGADPITTTSGSTSVSIADTSHARTMGDIVAFTGADDVGGLSLNGEWPVITVTDANNYVVQHTSAASSGATGGGASVVFTYEIAAGICDGTVGYGFGAGLFGAGFFGKARPTGGEFYARYWTFDAWGEDVLGSHANGKIYIHDTSAATRMTLASANAPSSSIYMFVTKEKHVVSLGAAGNPYQIKNSHQNDYTNWTASATSQADTFSLEGGEPIVGGRAFRDGVNLIWTRQSLWTRTFTDRQPFWNTKRRGVGMGLYGPHAHVEYGSLIYWMSDGDFYYFDGLSARPVPNSEDIRAYVFGDINTLQRDKAWGMTIRDHNEVWFFYVSGSAGEIDRYVIYYPLKGYWSHGSLARTAGVDRLVFEYPLMLGTPSSGVSKIYEHELGTDDDGAALTKYIKSAPLEIVPGGETRADVFQLIPDFKDQAEDVTITVEAKDKPNSTAETFGPYTAETTTEAIDTRISGRQLALTFTSAAVGGKFRLGDFRADIQPAGGLG